MIDLSDPSIYRDLSKPMGALNPNRYQCLLISIRNFDI